MTEGDRIGGYARAAARIRASVLRMSHAARGSHVGSSLSMADLLAVLYGGILRVDPTRPTWPDRDRFLLSKGHGAAAIYAALAGRGFFGQDWLETYCRDGSRLGGHVNHDGVPGVEVSTGSLGHGLPIGCGMALAARWDRRPSRVFVLLSDGECDEGSTWEAVLFAAHHRLENLIAIVDYNKIQSLGAVAEVLDLEPLGEKWRAFGWGVKEIDGHDLRQIESVLSTLPFQASRPSCLIAHTVKGKGVSFMEHQLAWHYRSPDDELLDRALGELELGP